MFPLSPATDSLFDQEEETSIQLCAVLTQQSGHEEVDVPDQFLSYFWLWYIEHMYRNKMP